MEHMRNISGVADDLDVPDETVHGQVILLNDLEVDTSTDTIEACSTQIKQFLDQGPSHRAFDQLRAATRH